MNDQNPYQPPGTTIPARSPRLARYERDTLSSYLAYHERPPSVPRYLLPYAVQWVRVFVGMALTMAACTYLLGSRFLDAAPIMLGVFIGFIVRDYTYARLVVALWPMLDEIFDWDRVRAKYDTLSQP